VRRPPRRRTSYENELASLLWKTGYVVCRCPQSGGGKKRYPCLDLLVWDPKTGKAYAIEVKTTNREDVFIEDALKMISETEKEKMEMLRKRGVDIVLAFRKRGKWRLFLIADDGIREFRGERPLDLG